MKPRVLVFGYGNPGRLDDGLGPALIDELVARGIDGVTVESAYQLQIEDAALLAQHELVVFADADASGRSPFELRRIEPEPGTAFSTHSVAPQALLALAHQHFAATTVGYVLGIRAHELDGFGERLSPQGRTNLLAAAEHLERVLREGSLVEEFASSQRER